MYIYIYISICHHELSFIVINSTNMVFDHVNQHTIDTIIVPITWMKRYCSGNHRKPPYRIVIKVFVEHLIVIIYAYLQDTG